MKRFVSDDLKNLKSQHRALTLCKWSKTIIYAINYDTYKSELFQKLFQNFWYISDIGASEVIMKSQTQEQFHIESSKIIVSCDTIRRMRAVFLQFSV